MKTLWRLSIVLLLVLALAACGNGETSEADSAGSDAADSDTSTGGESGGGGFTGPSSLDLTDMSTFAQVPGDYLMTLYFNFKGSDTDGDPIDGTLNIEGAFQEEPLASQVDMAVTGTGDLGGVDQVSFADLDGTLYFYSALTGCAQLPSEGGTPYDDFVDTGGFLSGEVQRVQPDEDVNGVPSYVFAITADNLDSSDPTSLSVEDILTGRLYVAKDGGFVTRITIEGRGTSEVLAQSDSLVGDVDYQLDFTPVSSVSISIPEACGGEANEIDYPLLDDAYDTTNFSGFVQYSTSYSFDEALDFYKEQMPAAGWTFESETIAGSTALLNYTMGSTQISVVLTQPTPDDPVMVTIGGD